MFLYVDIVKKKLWMDKFDDYFWIKWCLVYNDIKTDYVGKSLPIGKPKLFSLLFSERNNQIKLVINKIKLLHEIIAKKSTLYQVSYLQLQNWGPLTWVYYQNIAG